MSSEKVVSNLAEWLLAGWDNLIKILAGLLSHMKGPHGPTSLKSHSTPLKQEHCLRIISQLLSQWEVFCDSGQYSESFARLRGVPPRRLWGAEHDHPGAQRLRGKISQGHRKDVPRTPKADGRR